MCVPLRGQSLRGQSLLVPCSRCLKRPGSHAFSLRRGFGVGCDGARWWAIWHSRGCRARIRARAARRTRRLRLQIRFRRDWQSVLVHRLASRCRARTDSAAARSRAGSAGSPPCLRSESGSRRPGERRRQGHGGFRPGQLEPGATAAECHQRGGGGRAEARPRGIARRCTAGGRVGRRPARPPPPERSRTRRPGPARSLLGTGRRG